MTATAPAERTTAGSPSVRKVITSSAIGQFVEFYDFVIYAYSAAVLAKLFFPTDDPVAGVLSVFAVYAVGFAIRPLGGIVFGLLGDRIGRRRVLVIVITMMGAGTMAIGLLPTYGQVGILAPILLVLCRLVQGFSAAGETMTSNTFVAEHSPRAKRGLFVSFTYSFTTLPSVIAALVVWSLTTGLGPELYESWGWRIAFLIGGPMALIGFYIRAKIGESPVYEAAKAAEGTPLKKESSRKAIIQALSLCAIGALGFYTLSGYMVSYLTTNVGMPQDQALISNGIALTVCFVAFWLGGILSDRYGRRPVIYSAIVGVIVVYLPGFWLAGIGTFWSALIGQSVIGIVLGVYYGAYSIRVLESFSTRNRVSGAVICFNVSYTIFGGTAPLVSTWLITQTGSNVAPAIYMMVLAAVVLLIVPALRIPETAGTNLLHDDDRDASPQLAATTSR